MFRYLIFILLFPFFCVAQTLPTSQEIPASEPVSKPYTGPETVYIGMYVLRIDNIDLKTGSATVTYYLWARWTGEDIDGSLFELMSGSIEEKDHEYKYEENGVKYIYYRHRASINIDVDFTNFPFDEHVIRFDFEHSDLGQYYLRLKADLDAMKHLKSPELSGWIVDQPRYEITSAVYKTGWGHPGTGPNDQTSSDRFRTSIALRHEVSATFMKTFLLLFISMLIAYLAFVIHPTELEARIGIGVAGIFGAVTSQSVVADSLPEISYITLSDKVHIISLLFIFFSLLSSCFMGYLCRKEREETAERLDWVLATMMTVGYISIVSIFIIYRHSALM
jgi:hypothetical protein